MLCKEVDKVQTNKVEVGCGNASGKKRKRKIERVVGSEFMGHDEKKERQKKSQAANVTK